MREWATCATIAPRKLLALYADNYNATMKRKWKKNDLLYFSFSTLTLKQSPKKTVRIERHNDGFEKWINGVNEHEITKSTIEFRKSHKQWLKSVKRNRKKVTFVNRKFDRMYLSYMEQFDSCPVFIFLIESLTRNGYILMIYARTQACVGERMVRVFSLSIFVKNKL